MTDKQKALEYQRIFHWGEKSLKNIPEGFNIEGLENMECGVTGHIQEVNIKIAELRLAIYELLDREADFLTEEEIEEL